MAQSGNQEVDIKRLKNLPEGMRLTKENFLAYLRMASLSKQHQQLGTEQEMIKIMWEEASKQLEIKDIETDRFTIYENEIRDIKEINEYLQEKVSHLEAEIEVIHTMRNMVIEADNRLYDFPIWIEQEGDWYIALIPDLDIASQGHTVIEAFENLKDLMTVYFDEKTTDSKKEKFERYIKK